MCVSASGSRQPLTPPLPSTQGEESSLEGKQEKNPPRKLHILNGEKSGISWPDIMCDLVHDLAASAGFVRDFSGLAVSFPK